MGLRPNVILIAVGAFTFFVGVPVMQATTQALLQNQVPIGLQGRVFSLKRMMALSASAVAYSAAGPLADKVFEPLMQAGHPVADAFGVLTGVGPGRGIALMFVLLGLLTVAMSVSGALHPALKAAERASPSGADIASA